jgi:adenylate cyclase
MGSRSAARRRQQGQQPRSGTAAAPAVAGAQVGDAAKPAADRVPEAALEAALLGATCDMTRDDVAAAAGVPEPEARAIWNALGFPSVEPDVRAFTARDVDELRLALELRESDRVNPDTVLVLARALGQDLARTAEAMVEVFRDFSSGLGIQDAATVGGQAAADAVPRLEALVTHVWRRHFTAAVQRGLVREQGSRTLAVGFIDIVDFTRSTRTWDHATLERMLEHFERDASLRVAMAGGRVVKTLGDAVLFVTPDAVTAVEVALEVVAAHAEDDQLPDVRAGVAQGPVLERVGDVFGEPVNLASRLVGEARPRTVLVDAAVASVLAGHRSLEVRRLTTRSVRGYRTLTPHLIRRS